MALSGNVWSVSGRKRTAVTAGYISADYMASDSTHHRSTVVAGAVDYSSTFIPQRREESHHVTGHAPHSLADFADHGLAAGKPVEFS